VTNIASILLHLLLQVPSQTISQSNTLTAKVTVAAAVALPEGAVADTTGAGDSFFGAVLYGLSTGIPAEKMLQLASLVAACKCTALGARTALPRRSDITEELLRP
jgi:sugar/nucleoside kinase (ribokinase family)